ncbi:MAG: protein translocase subunit SecF, partial [Acidimicrobiia bacterium]
MNTVDQIDATAENRSLWFKLYHGLTTFDFVGKRKYGFALSGVVLLISVISLFGRGLNLGIDFKGGVSWEFQANNVEVSQVEDILADAGLADGSRVQTLSSASGTRIRAQVGPLEVDKQNSIRAELAEVTGVQTSEVDLSSVSASWGDEITRKAVKALIVFFILLTAYISFRFEWKMAVGAFVAVVHDVLISVGIYSVFDFEVAPATVIAFLTILGFSLYDTIVVFDRVHDNARRLNAGSKTTYSDEVNLSMNQVLMRSLNTSLAALLPVLSLLIVGSWMMGARALKDFALALFIGLLTGSYSSIYVATPVLAVLKEREPRYRALQEKAAGTSVASRAAGAKAATTRLPAAAGGL